MSCEILSMTSRSWQLTESRLLGIKRTRFSLIPLICAWKIVALCLVSSQVTWKGKIYTYRFICVSIKGDWPFLRKAANLANGYNCNNKCHRCCFGAEAMEEFSNL